MGAPSLLDAQARQILANAAVLAERGNTNVHHGFICSDGGTTQGSGAGTALNFDVDVTIGVGRVKGIAFQLAAGTDIDSDAGISFGATSGKKVIYACVVECGTANDTPAYKAIPGAAADTADAVAPTDAEITTAVGHENWVRICDNGVERTADTAVTLTYDHACQAGSADILHAIAQTEAAARAV